jgi:hypothetical protein
MPLYTRMLVPVISFSLYLRADDTHGPIPLIVRHLLPVVANADRSDEPWSASAWIVFSTTAMPDAGSAGFLQPLPPLSRIVGYIFLITEDLPAPH